ncbi:hypothetical protein, partial [Bradyrhizobium brasilense]|uniref:hypothetical protein n=1 Tax=Bradyrhizobium brasilense TaxID=1419277 RepID=UPI001E41FFEF
ASAKAGTTAETSRGLSAQALASLEYWITRMRVKTPNRLRIAPHIRCRPGESQDPLPQVSIVERHRAAIPLITEDGG